MVSVTASNRARGSSKRSGTHLSLRERLMANGTYTSSGVSQGDNQGTVPLFSPIKVIDDPEPFTKPVKKPSQPRQQKVPGARKGRLSQVKASTKSKDSTERFSFTRDPKEATRIKDSSESLLSRLTSDASDSAVVQVLDTSSMEASSDSRVEFGDASCTPLFNHPSGAGYGIMHIGPSSRFGPMVNTRGVMVLVVIESDDRKLFYDGFNLVGKSRLHCPRQSHILVLPDDVFMLINESSTSEARVLMVSCRKDSADFHIEQHVKGAILSPSR
ncbi:hypothetical protein BBOV_III005250 [Babesia bovis T2Bo]|uniref:Uncharacterized protein n=1 Tax=Babesia bovis TaxID=5865 RepID=A7ANF4_BABBO|nr:hypothetical protein BBOV_III005250 [Babesia bovis T2Bo]EDO08088.1 hypothetical protein BBOV_III005250 [Babesia bovis T2Bo]|eukprot:XP_001611656.1 hypothetical protein [Babesia bovis T2Bo]